MAWATTDDVSVLTAQTVADDEVARAQSRIELFVGRREATATGELSANDLEWLRRAVAYQAAWEKGQADLDTRVNVRQLSQEGVSTTFTPDGLVLAPLARKAIRRLSWVGGGRGTSQRAAPYKPDDPVRYPVLPPGGAIIDYDFERWGRL